MQPLRIASWPGRTKRGASFGLLPANGFTPTTRATKEKAQPRRFSARTIRVWLPSNVNTTRPIFLGETRTSSQTQADHMHVILVSVGTDGDIFPYVGLGTALRARG